jgi:glycosyltransferase involved in cell wall biosynthesis
VRIVYISTYPPRMCGLATFTSDLKEAIGTCQDPEDLKQSYVIAMQDTLPIQEYGEDVQLVIHQDRLEDYIAAAAHIEHSSAEVCVISHEYGIYGGLSGLYLLSLLENITIPVVTVLHTILDDPEFHAKQVTEKLIERSSRIIVMNRKARSILQHAFTIDDRKLTIIPHGTPDVDFHAIRERSRQKLKVTDRYMLFTFGLISADKGLETVIAALPPVVRQYPDVVYYIVGKTHPHVSAREGEVYREAIDRLIRRLHLDEQVLCIDSYVSDEELVEYLAAADIYLLPYHNTHQITSGTLSFALSAGNCVLSTPNWHAQEVLKPQVGILFDPGDSAAVTRELLRVLGDPQLLASYKRHAYAYGEGTRWRVTAGRYISLLGHVLEEPVPRPPSGLSRLSTLTHIDLSQLQLLTDATGIVQHARYHLPNYRHGYSLDDNARALSLCCELLRSSHVTLEQKLVARGLIDTFLSFLMHMQDESGNFHGFMLADRSIYLEKRRSEDTFGRTLRALTQVLTSTLPVLDRELAGHLFAQALPLCSSLVTPRGIAQTILALITYLDRRPERDHIGKVLADLSEKLITRYDLYQQNLQEEVPDHHWYWFEDILSYENGIVPQALIELSRLQTPSLYSTMPEDRDIGAEAHEKGYAMLSFLEGIMHRGPVFSLVGNDGWYPRGGHAALFDQQPIDAASMVHLYGAAYRDSGKAVYKDRMIESFLWFHGDNPLHIALYDRDKGGCHDGLERTGINLNMGAESTLEYLAAALKVLTIINGR